MKYNKLTRRIFLQGAGGAILGMPVLESLLSREAQGANPGGPRHFIAIKSYSGQIPADFYPQASNGDRYAIRNGTTSPSISQDGTVILTNDLGVTERTVNGSTFKFAPMTEFSNAGFSSLLRTNFNPYLDQLTCIRGIDFLQKADHNQGGMLGHFNSANINRLQNTYSFSERWESIDQVIARVTPYSLKPYRSLHFAPNYTNQGRGASGGGDNNASSMSFRYDGTTLETVPFDRDPRAVFNRIFVLGGGSGGSGGTPSAADLRRIANLSVLDLVFPELQALSRSSRLSADDRRIVDEHATFIRDLQARLQPSTGGGGGPSVACDPPDESTIESRSTVESTDVVMVRDLIRDSVDVAVAAIRCGLTDVITLDISSAICLSGGSGSPIVRYHNPNTAGGNNWHALAHLLDGDPGFGDPSYRGEWTQINRFIAEEVFLRTIAGLDTIENGGSTFLDNSIVFWGNEISYNHTAVSMPTLLAGGAGGRLAAGRYIDYSDWSADYGFRRGGRLVQGLAYNRLWVSILQAMGLAPSEYEKSGISGYGEQTLMSMSGMPSTFGDVSSPLPGLLNP